MLLSQVEAMREQLRPSERKLADYVMEAPREVLDMAMTDFAARVGVSQPTIARFCQALGFSGFREFKIRLAQSIASVVPAPAVFRDVRADEPAAGVVAKVLDRTIGALLQVRNSLSSDSVGNAIALLAQARRIEFWRGRIGNRRTGYPAQVLPARRAECRVFRSSYVHDIGGIAGCG